MQLLGNILIDGLTYGMVLFIIAVGMSITLGLMRFINLAHGAFAMIGGYLTAALTREWDWSFFVALPLALVVTALVGAVLEALILRHLYRRSELDQVLFTFGLTYVLIATINAIAGPQVQLIALPAALTASVDLGFRVIPVQRIVVVLVGIAVALLSAQVIGKTRFGVWLRAAVDHPATAATLGIPIRVVQCATFAFGAGLAALGGVLGAELMPLEPYYALKYLVLVLVVVAVGGMGSLMGALAAAVLLGMLETATNYFTEGWGSIAFFVAMALLLVWRPNGLLRR
ncbi:MAG: ABC transporter permease [Comamonas sp. SCN 65-56]|uniref:branched-chain amino acid ABC transporter permease n=1 Tax=Comamonas sp. SCN 65-56 TaxID=1660095 RepID=UPI000868FD0A|nr:branched-chain amino acid ABC transporter permease [Comamonas sp. SCN 65-56]ODS90776.1 MAG: ABC transporter permease [Comamonas sp. SCN 65-56]